MRTQPGGHDSERGAILSAELPTPGRKMYGLS